MTRHVPAVLLIAVLVGACSGRDQQKAEQETKEAGQQVEHAANQAGEAAKKTAGEVGERVESAADKVKEEVAGHGTPHDTTDTTRH